MRYPNSVQSSTLPHESALSQSASTSAQPNSGTATPSSSIPVAPASRLGRIRIASRSRSRSKSPAASSLLPTAVSTSGLTSPSPSKSLSRARKIKPSKGCLKRHPFVIGGAVAALIVFALYLGDVFSSTPDGPPKSFTSSFSVLVDAGSSGSRVHVYRYIHGRVDEIFPQSTSIKTKTNIPLSSFASSPEGAFSSLEELLTSASSLVPAHAHSRTPLRIWATAGLRLLTQEQQRGIFDALETAVRSKFSFVIDSQSSFQIISGRLEAVYAWLTLNYLAFAMSPTTSNRHTGALLEMGGASLQFCYEMDDDEWDEVPAGQRFEADLSSFHHLPRELARKVRLYAVSWLGFGSARARNSYYDGVLPSQKDASSLEVNDPCVQMGYNESMQSPFVLHGKGDFAECQKKLSTSLLESNVACKHRDGRPWWRCGLSGTGLPWPRSISSTGQMIVYGTRTIFFSTRDVIGMAGEFDAQIIRNKWSSVCAAEAGPRNTLPGRYCFQCAWVSSVLSTHGLDLLSSSTPMITIDQVNGIDVSWQLGVALYHPPHHQDFKPSYEATNELLFSIVVYGCIVAAIFLGAMFYLVGKHTWRIPFAKIRRRRRAHHQSHRRNYTPVDSLA